MSKLTILDIKQALWDERFQNLFPEHKDEIKDFIKDPGCSCNVDFYKKLMRYKDRLAKYFPTKDIVEEDIRSDWKVINCHINELEKNLRKLGKGRKQVAVARYQDQVTVIVNEIDF